MGAKQKLPVGVGRAAIGCRSDLMWPRNRRPRVRVFCFRNVISGVAHGLFSRTVYTEPYLILLHVLLFR